MKKRKLDNAAPIIIRPQNEVEGYFGNSNESQDGALDKTGVTVKINENQLC